MISGFFVVSTRTEMAKLPAGSVAYLTERYHPDLPGREGIFVWREGDFTAFVAADPYQGVCVAHETIPASIGAFIRDHDKGRCHAEWWGVRSVYDTEVDYLLQDDSARLNSAMAYIESPVEWESVHFMFERGGELLLPRGFTYATAEIHIPAGVYIEGNGTQSSGIVTSCSNDVVHNIFIGRKDQVASFSCGLRNLCVKDVQGRADVARDVDVVYTEAAQHTGGVDNVLIYSGGRTCFRANAGYGGATYLTVKNLETANFGASQLPEGTQANPQVVLNYSSAMIYAENMVTQGSSEAEYAGGSTAKGCVVGSGYVTFRNYHVEQVATGIEVNVKTAYGHVRVEGATGGTNVGAVISCQSDAFATAAIQLENIRKNDANYTYRDFRAGKTSYTTDIVAFTTP
ncbi:hypothetical protein DMY87_18040 [Rhizobium wuzhouense]|uniref:Right-handed parallel beta-helix repeat-containing protein n=2 Tax=Rhizobium wuzhouense TaxID=1986026 RepID=A0ABX5NRT4_9HYPH|nr:hypothetical protein DMY87_18040 [Rhizobium wuzhouense]